MLNQFQQRENHNISIAAAKELGCNIVNIDPDDLVNGRVHLVLGLLWQLIKVRLASTWPDANNLITYLTTTRSICYRRCAPTTAFSTPSMNERASTTTSPSQQKRSCRRGSTGTFLVTRSSPTSPPIWPTRPATRYSFVAWHLPPSTTSNTYSRKKIWSSGANCSYGKLRR